ncbi:hypothetical protein WME99_15760 [Sorangium sp. So ce136]
MARGQGGQPAAHRRPLVERPGGEAEMLVHLPGGQMIPEVGRGRLRVHTS